MTVHRMLVGMNKIGGGCDGVDQGFYGGISECMNCGSEIRRLV